MKMHHAGLLILLLGSTAWPALRSVEQGLELEPAQVTLPSRSDAPLTVRRCPSCAVMRLGITAATRWQSGADEGDVGRAAFAAALATAARQPGTLVHVYYDPAQDTVTRVVLDTPLGAQR